MGELMGNPYRDEVGRKTHAVGLRIYQPGKVLEAEECHSATADYQLAGVGPTKAYHEVGVSRAVDADQLVRPSGSFLGELHYISRGSQPVEVAAIRPQSRGDNGLGVRSIRIENVVAPVGVEDGTMTLTVLPVRRL